jgi:N-acetylmuramic acid 6-phosphate etherase
VKAHKKRRDKTTPASGSSDSGNLIDLRALQTERQNRASAHLDQLGALQIATLMNREEAKTLRAVRLILPAIARAVDLVHDRLKQGGRLIYVGTGTSGRIGALDASECPPTFGTDAYVVQYLIAGGVHALTNATESSEDSRKLGAADMAARRPRKKDVVVALAASGRTPYTIAALQYARKKGAATIAVVCNKGSELAAAAELALEPDVGPEVLTGSTRLKAGTAEEREARRTRHLHRAARRRGRPWCSAARPSGRGDAIARGTGHASRQHQQKAGRQPPATQPRQRPPRP